MSIREVIATATVAALLQGAGHAQTFRLLPKKSAPKSESEVAAPKSSATQGRRVMTLRRAPQGFRVLTQNKKSKEESGVTFRQLPRRHIVVVPNTAPKGGRILELSPRSGHQAVRRPAPTKRQPQTARRRIMLGAGAGSAAKQPPVRIRRPVSQSRTARRRIVLGAGAGGAAQQPPVRIRRPVAPSSTARLEARMSELTREIRELRHLLERLERHIGNNRRGRRWRR